MDVTNVIFKEAKAAQDAGKKGGKKDGESKAGGATEKTASTLSAFVRAVMDAILSNGILKDASQYFQFRHSFQEQIEYVKKQYKGVGGGGDEQAK